MKRLMFDVLLGMLVILLLASMLSPSNLIWMLVVFLGPILGIFIDAIRLDLRKKPH
jgi:positive regulator of sigma E activity